MKFMPLTRSQHYRDSGGEIRSLTALDKSSGILIIHFCPQEDKWVQ